MYIVSAQDLSESKKKASMKVSEEVRVKLLIGLLDDEACWLEQLSELISENAESAGITAEIVCFSEFSELESYNGKKPDAVFLDIELNEEHNGIEVAKWINLHWKHCNIVFMSNYHSYIMDAYTTDHVYFVLKSRANLYIADVLKKLKSDSESRIEKYVFRAISAEQQYISLERQEIIYFERTGRKTRIVCKDCEYETWEKIQDINSRLNNEEFFRCHNSFIVSIREIDKISKEEIVMSDGTLIKISRPYRISAAEAFAEWAEKHTVII